MRFLLYANEWDMAGIIYCRSRFHWKGHDWAGEDWIPRDIDLYAQTYENLKRHAPGFPSPQELKDRVYIGNTFSKPSSKCSRRLARSNLPSSVIAEDVGLANVQAFNKFSRKFLGMSPREYRRRT